MGFFRKSPSADIQAAVALSHSTDKTPDLWCTHRFANAVFHLNSYAGLFEAKAVGRCDNILSPVSPPPRDPCRVAHCAQNTRNKFLGFFPGKLLDGILDELVRSAYGVFPYVSQFAFFFLFLFEICGRRRLLSA